jgi:hypothetical protein
MCRVTSKSRSRTKRKKRAIPTRKHAPADSGEFLVFLDPEQRPTTGGIGYAAAPRELEKRERDRERNERERKGRRKGEKGERGRGDDDCWVTETAGWRRDWCGPEEKKPLVA